MTGKERMETRLEIKRDKLQGLYQHTPSVEEPSRQQKKRTLYLSNRYKESRIKQLVLWHKKKEVSDARLKRLREKVAQEKERQSSVDNPES